MDKPLKIRISAGASVFLAALLLMLPLQWVGAVILAAMVHECCHAAAIILLGGTIESVTIGGRGVVMETQPMSGIRETVCALAGPIGSVMLLLFVRWLPRTAVCGVIHGIYNMIPLFPLDGGRVLRGMLFGLLQPPKAETIFLWSQRAVILVLVAGCIFLTFRIGVLPLLFGILLLRSQKRENPLAKNPFWRYNRSNIDKGVRL